MLHVASGVDDSIVITGLYGGQVDFGGVPLTGGGAFVAKFSGDGHPLWARDFGDPGSCGARIVSDRNGDIYFTGACNGPVAFGSIQLNCDGMFIASVDSEGVPRWAITNPRDPSLGAPDLATLGERGVVTTVDANGSARATAVSFRGEPLWSSTIPPGYRHHVAAAPDGGVLVTAASHVEMISAVGTVRWDAPAGYDIRAATVLPWGNSIVASDALWALDTEGMALDSFAVNGLERFDSLVTMPDGGLAFVGPGALVMLEPP